MGEAVRRARKLVGAPWAPEGVVGQNLFTVNRFCPGRLEIELLDLQAGAGNLDQASLSRLIELDQEIQPRQGPD